MTTFVFKSERNWLRVWDALNDTYAPFTSYGYKAITVFDDKTAEMVRTACAEAKIKFTEE